MLSDAWQLVMYGNVVAFSSHVMKSVAGRMNPEADVGNSQLVCTVKFTYIVRNLLMK